MGTMEISRCNFYAGCDACFYADECPLYCGTGNGTAMATVKCARLALCESRHPMPAEVEGSIFPETVNPTELLRLRATCKRSLDSALAGGIKYLVVYVTGLTVALVEVMNYCHRNNVHLVLMHYNRETGEYYPQEVD